MLLYNHKLVTFPLKDICRVDKMIVNTWKSQTASFFLSLLLTIVIYTLKWL